MIHPVLSWLLGAICAVSALSVAAQSGTQTPAAAVTARQVTDPGATVPPLNHASAIQRHQGYSDDASVPWRQANDTARQIGGWRAYAREASAPDEPAKPASPHHHPMK